LTYWFLFFSDLLLVRHDTVRAVSGNNYVRHVLELASWQCSSDCYAWLGGPCSLGCSL